MLGPGAWAQGGGDGAAGGARLQRDAYTVVDTGASGLVVQARDARGRDREARAGVRDLARGGRIPFGVYYRIGSDTKTFVAVAALQLVADGKLSLDDTIDKWLPGVVKGNGNDGSRVTVRNLLQHTSGLPNYTDILFSDPRNSRPRTIARNGSRRVPPKSRSRWPCPVLRAGCRTRRTPAPRPDGPTPRPTTS